MKELNKLIREIIDFSDVIAYNDNPANSDFQNACYLFSCYLDTQIKEIKQQLRAVNSDQEITTIINEINKLDNLISLPRNTTAPYIEWTRNLFQHCEVRQHHEPAVA